MSNSQMNQPTGLEMIVHPTANQELSNPTGGMEMIVQQPSYTQEAPIEGLGGESIPAIEADPISFFNLKTVSSTSKKRKRGTASERQEILEKDFTLEELFKSSNIEELNQGRERTLDPQEVLTNLKGWKVEKRMRLENNGNGKVDKIYHHPKSRKKLRSLIEVTKFIEANSYQRKASDTGEGSSQDPNVRFSSSGGELFRHPYVNLSSSGGELFQDQNVNFSSPGVELFQDPHFNSSSLDGAHFNFSSLGSDQFFQDPNLNFYSSGGELFQHPNFNIFLLGGGLFQDPNANLSSLGGEMFQHSNVDISSSGGDVLQDPLPCVNPKSKFYLHVYASLIKGYKQEQQLESLRSTQASSSNPIIDLQTVEQVLGSSRGYNPGTGRRLASMASSSKAHLQPQSQELLYTQRQVYDMLQAQNRAMAEQVGELEERNRATHAKVDSILTLLRRNANEERKVQ